MECEMEWEGKYKSELLMVCHQSAQAMYAVGAISDKEMKEYDRNCLVSVSGKTLKNKDSGVSRKPEIVYAVSGSSWPASANDPAEIYPK